MGSGGSILIRPKGELLSTHGGHYSFTHDVASNEGPLSHHGIAANNLSMQTEGKLDDYHSENNKKTHHFYHREHGDNIEGDSKASEDGMYLKELLNPIGFGPTIRDGANAVLKGTCKWILDDFAAFLGSQDSMRIFSAPGGVGKTAIICKLVRDDSNVAGYFFCRHDATEQQDPRRLLCTISYQLSMHKDLVEYRAALMSLHLTAADVCVMNPVALFDVLLAEPLGRIRKVPTRPFAVLIDALDECGEHSSNQIVDFMTRSFRSLPAWLKVYVTTRPHAPIMDKLRRLQPSELAFDSDQINADLKFYYDFRLQGNIEAGGDSGEENNAEATASQLLVQKSEGQFLYASKIGKRFRGKRKISLNDVNACPTGLRALYFEQFQSFKRENFGGLLDMSVMYISVSREPLHVRALQDLLGCSMEELHPVLKRLSHFFPVRDHCISVAHKSLSDWLFDELDDENDHAMVIGDHPKQMHRRLAMRCMELIDGCGDLFDATRTRAKQKESEGLLFAMRHVVHHSLVGGEAHNARKVLIRHDFLIARAALGGSMGILRDCEAYLDMCSYARDAAIYYLRRCLDLAMSSLLASGRQMCAQLTCRLTHLANEGTVAEITTLVKNVRGFTGFSWVTLRGIGALNQAHDPCVTTIRGHNGVVRCLSWSPDGNRIVSGCEDSLLRVWDVDSGHLLHVMGGHNDIIYCVDWSCDGAMIVSGGADKVVRLWGASTGMLLRQLEGHWSMVQGVVFNPNCDGLASGSADGTIRVWAVTTGDSYVLESHGDSITCLAWSPDGRWLASGSVDMSVHIWPAEASAAVSLYRELAGHRDWVTSIAWGPDSTILASASQDASIRLWNVSSGEHILAIDLVAYGWARCIAFSPDGSALMSGGRDAMVRLWKVETGVLMQTYQGHESCTFCAAWSGNGKLLASGSKDKMLRIWDAAADTSISAPSPESPRCDGHTDSIYCLARSPDCQFLASAGQDGTVHVWDGQTGALWRVLRGLGGWVRGLTWGPDSRHLVSGSRDGHVRLWDATSGDFLRCWEGHGEGVVCVAVDESGKHVASGSYDMTIRIFDMDSDDVLLVLRGHEDTVRCLSWSSDGMTLASGSEDTTVRVWNVITGDVLHVLEGHEDDVHSVAFCSNGALLASSSLDETVRIWQSTSGEEIHNLGAHHDHGHADDVFKVCWNKDGSLLASASSDGSVSVWDPQCGTSIKTVYEPHKVLWQFSHLEAHFNSRVHNVMMPCDDMVYKWIPPSHTGKFPAFVSLDYMVTVVDTLGVA